jgi:hypothetical protein
MGSRVRGQVKPVKSAIGAPHAIVVWQVDIRASPTSGFITRNVHASNQILGGGVHSHRWCCSWSYSLDRPDTRSTANETDRNVHLTGERSAVY